MAVNRRTFLKIAGLAAAGSLSRGLHAEPPKPPKDDSYRPPIRNLGQTGLSCSLLGIGTGTNGFGGRSKQTELGRKKLVSLLEYAADRGVTYFDLADQYGSHTFMRSALQSGGGTIDRDKVYVLTKTHARDAKGMREDLDRFRKEIGTDVLDTVLLHCKFSADWPKHHAGAMEVLSEAKEKGIIRAHGVSCHSLQALQTAATEPWVDVDLARLNPWGVQMDANVQTVKGVLRQMRDRNKAIIGMKILGAGRARSESEVSEGIRHAVKSDLLDSFTIGVSDKTELDQLLNHMNRELS